MHLRLQEKVHKHVFLKDKISIAHSYLISPTFTSTVFLKDKQSIAHSYLISPTFTSTQNTATLSTSVPKTT